MRSKWMFAPLSPLSFDLVAIDPPWPFDLYSAAGEEKSPQAQYETMTREEILAMPVGDLARGDCLLLCWCTWPQLELGLAAVRAWGFSYVTTMVWQKVTKNGRPAMGPGYRVRSLCEPCLIAVVGEPRHKPFKGLFPGVRREHSRKPEAFYEAIDRCCPDLTFRADVFARQSRPGWATWGREATKFDPTDSAATLIPKCAPRRRQGPADRSGPGERLTPDMGRLPQLFPEAAA